ncbi:MAG: J domain-containing protein [Alphaproteobacteria bacterium]|nr:J domain-containing protein [Alphaproteobacteria bacterium]
MPGCQGCGEHKAPKHRALNEYYHFCFDHIKEYNTAWNFFQGMSEAEIQSHIVDSVYGFRPTRRYDADGQMAERLREAAWQTYHFTEEKPRRERTFTEEQRQTPEMEALAIMELTPPITLAAIKVKYKALAKKHHPDLNKGCKNSEDLLKRINMAYTILKLAYAEFEDLPDR